MWGLIAKLTILPGRRDEMIGLLKQSAAKMPGCFSYVVTARPVMTLLSRCLL